MPVPHSPSLTDILTSQAHTAAPVCDWLRQLRAPREGIDLIIAVQGIPCGWLEWAERRVNTAEKRGIKIASRTAYALQTLWHGITLLQECKFLCDTMENALRSAIGGWTAINQITVEQLFPRAFRCKIGKRVGGVGLEETAVVSAELLLTLSFHQLERTIFLNWHGLPTLHDHHRAVMGIGKLFATGRECRDRNRFRDDMSAVRQTRNDVAHSRRLFSPEELRHTYKCVCTWLRPLSVELMSKVSAYRRNRPRFLHDLDVAD